MQVPPHAILKTVTRSTVPQHILDQQQAIIAQDKARERFRKIFGSYPPSLISGERLRELFRLENLHNYNNQ